MTGMIYYCFVVLIAALLIFKGLVLAHCQVAFLQKHRIFMAFYFIYKYALNIYLFMVC